MIIFIGILLLGIVGFFIHLYASKEPKTSLRIVELFLLYQLVFSVGLISLLAFFGLTFMPEFVAKYSGWDHCQFQQQLANVNLGYGVLGILCIWKRNDFWLATILGLSIWLLGDAMQHIYHMIYYHNYTEGNAGLTLYTDILVPLELLILYAAYKYLQKHENVDHISG